MPYRHSDHAHILRDALLRLKRDKIGAEFLRKQLYSANRKLSEQISRQTLEAFINDNRPCTKVVALAALWEFLRGHEVYRTYFRKEEAQPSTHAELLGRVIAKFLRVPPVPAWTLSPADTRIGFLGEFLIFYPQFGGQEANRLQIAQFTVTGENIGVVIGFNNPAPAYRQWGSGVALPLGDLMCFTAGRQHSAATPGLEEGIYIGIVDAAVRASGGEPTVNCFKGLLFRTDGPVLFPFIKFFAPVRFFCRRFAMKPDWPLLEEGVVKTLDGLEYEEELRALLLPE